MLKKLFKRKKKLSLAEEHSEENIAKRLAEENQEEYLKDAVLGGIDGCVTTFAIVAGTVGGGFSSVVALALGLSNLVADGFSMAVSNYQATKSVKDRYHYLRQKEIHDIKMIPEGEKEEVRQMYAKKGFEGDLLEKIVNVITSDEKLWIDTMLKEEHDISLNAPNALKASIVTFLAFLFVGLFPLLPFFLNLSSMKVSFALSTFLTAFAFYSVGLVKGHLLKLPIWKEGLEVLIFGGCAASMAYIVSYFISLNFSVT